MALTNLYNDCLCLFNLRLDICCARPITHLWKGAADEKPITILVRLEERTKSAW